MPEVQTFLREALAAAERQKAMEEAAAAEHIRLRAAAVKAAAQEKAAAAKAAAQEKAEADRAKEVASGMQGAVVGALTGFGIGIPMAAIAALFDIPPILILVASTVVVAVFGYHNDVAAERRTRR